MVDPILKKTLQLKIGKNETAPCNNKPNQIKQEQKYE